jgi:hypothetical protein
MEGLAFLLAIIGVGLVILWARKNDKVPLDGETGGLLAMAKGKARPTLPRRMRSRMTATKP